MPETPAVVCLKHCTVTIAGLVDISFTAGIREVKMSLKGLRFTLEVDGQPETTITSAAQCSNC